MSDRVAAMHEGAQLRIPPLLARHDHPDQHRLRGHSGIIGRFSVLPGRLTTGNGQSAMPMNALGVDDHALAAFCARHHIRRLSLFGSTLRGTARPDSDVDLLVEFETGQEPGLLRLARMEIELSLLLGGRRIDLRTLQDLSRYFRDDVLRTAKVQYAA